MQTPPFSELGLRPELLAAINDLGFERPSAIQALTIVPAIEGKDLVGLSETGSGKTAAFTLPVLNRIDLDQREPQALIVCPTRELCVQVCEEVHRLGAHLPGLHALPIYGGAPMDRQIRGLKAGTHVVVGNPGRLLDHLRRNTLKTGTVKFAVLDEADRMLDMGFREDMEQILAGLHADRQTLFFSATMNRAVENLIHRFSNDPVTLEVPRETLTVAATDQSYYEVRRQSKIEVLSRLIDRDAPRLAIVFCNTKRATDEVTESLLARGYAADRLHGDITQQMRERVLARFREGSVELLVATDFAARVLDVDDIDTVFNYDLPHDPEDYVHRIGRTGRAGRSGRAISFVFGKEIYKLQQIEKYIRQKVTRSRIPTQEEVEGQRANRIFDTVRDRLEGGEFERHEDLIGRLMEHGHAATDVAAALITLLREQDGREAETIVEDRSPQDGPRQPRNDRGDRYDRGDRRDRDRGRNDRPAYEPTVSSPEAGRATLFLSLGKSAGIAPGDIAGMLYREAAAPDGSIGKITLFPRHTLIDVPADIADTLINRTQNATLRGQPFRIDHDRGRPTR
ncbi:DEAD/DEAH box helicase [soil metagenome]